MDSFIDQRRRKLKFRSWHRGTREIDLLLGRFADHFLPDCTSKQLDAYEHLLSCNDPDIYDWIMGRHPADPAIDKPLLNAIRKFLTQPPSDGEGLL